jgi:hypothetical protein
MCLCCFNKESMKARWKGGKLIFIQVLFIKMLNQKTKLVAGIRV